MGGMMNSMTKTSYYGDQSSLPKLQKEYMAVTQNYLSTKYREVLKNRNNLQIAMEKKYFDKIQTMRTNVLAQRKVKRIGWKEFLINYLDKQSRTIEWYSDIVEDMKNAVFLNENKYLSHIFFKEFERNTKPKCLQNILNSDYGDSNNNDYNEQIVEFNDLEENIINRLSSIHPDMTNNPKESLCLSKIDLTGVTENLGGSFFSSKSQSISSNDPGKNYKKGRNRIKYLVKIFKEHLSNKDHPITIAMEIFERHMSYVIGFEIGELKKQREKNEANYEQNISDISAEIVEHIQKFIIKTQNALKLYYGAAVNLECFLEEKDELINLITSCFFQTGKIYAKVYELFSMQINKKILDLDARLKQMSSLTPRDIDIPDKFSLDEATIRYQNELKENSKGVVHNKKQDQIIINNELTGRITVSSGRVELNQKFHEHNKKQGYSTVIKIIHGLKHNKVPFEKMLLIASISTEITECVNAFWEGYEDIIPSSSLLNINADELMAIFIYIVVKAQFPEILLHQKIVNDFTSRTTKSTMIGYYNTTLEAAIEYIQKERFGKEKNNSSIISDKFFSLTEGKNIINTTNSNNN